MERIKQALDRAREQRESLGFRRPAFEGGQPSEQESTTIKYSQTVVQPVSRQVLRENNVIAGIDREPAATSFKLLRTKVLQRLTANGWNTLAVTSGRPGQGKTLTATNLALSLAREVHFTVLLVDLDLRRPSVHKVLGLRPELGLSDYLTHGVPLHEILINPGIERVVVLPGGGPLANSSEMLKSRKMATLVEEIKNRYPSRLIIFDMPPLLTTDDALAFLPYTESVLLVIEDGVTTKTELKECGELLKGSNVIGTVLNRSAHADVTGYY
jgi:capsular exopolysaccharide synthesis family protein